MRLLRRRFLEAFAALPLVGRPLLGDGRPRSLIAKSYPTQLADRFYMARLVRNPTQYFRDRRAIEVFSLERSRMGPAYCFPDDPAKDPDWLLHADWGAGRDNQLLVLRHSPGDAKDPRIFVHDSRAALIVVSWYGTNRDLGRPEIAVRHKVITPEKVSPPQGSMATIGSHWNSSALSELT